MSAPPPTSPPTTSSAHLDTPRHGFSPPDQPTVLRGDDNAELDKLPHQLLWLGTFAVMVTVAGAAAGVVTVFRQPSWAIPAISVLAAVTVIVTGALLLTAVQVVRNARDHALAAIQRSRPSAAVHPRYDEKPGPGHDATGIDTADHFADLDQEFAGEFTGQVADQSADDQHGRSSTGPRAARAPWQKFAQDRAPHDPTEQPAWDPPHPTTAVALSDTFARLVFVNLARRLQTFISRSLDEIEKLERAHEDPELLAGLYHVNHMFTLARRQAENLAVLGGQSPDRRITEPVDVHEMLLSAVSEVEKFSEIDLIPVDVPDVQGRVASEITHLLAELMENATHFTPPNRPKVDVRANRVESGLAIEISDRGLGMPFSELQAINRILDGTDHLDVTELVRDGRIGLAVVRELAKRHDINVELKRNIHGGVVATVVIPPQWLWEPDTRPTTNPTDPAPRRRRLDDHAARQRALPQRPSTRLGDAHWTVEPQRQLAPPAPAAPALSTLTTPAHLDSTLAYGPDQDPDQATARATTFAATPADHGAPDYGAPDYGAHPRHSQHDRSADPHPPGAPESLPVRNPGTTFSRLAGTTPSTHPDPHHTTPPPLPVRDGTSYMPAELHQPPVGPAVLPGHRADLFGAMRAGRAHSHNGSPNGTPVAGQPAVAGDGPAITPDQTPTHTRDHYPSSTAAPDHTNPDPAASHPTASDPATHSTTQGDATPWPRT